MLGLKTTLWPLALTALIWYATSIQPSAVLNRDSNMTEELEVLKIVTSRLNQANILYMVSGSIAANYYTVPRMTRDIDIIVELKQGDADKFVSLFETDFYVNRQMITNEISRQGMFNLIHNQHVIKIDFVIKKSSPYSETAFSRRKEIPIEDIPMWFISAEDLIISKLIWAKDSHSDVQLRDVRNLLQTVENLDSKYIDDWVRQLHLQRLYNETKQ